ncbi:MAG: septum formation inhibitor Maf [Methylomarinum sp.]|nr:septum formation inhibitor Maf [Methylomarinum sp.]
MKELILASSSLYRKSLLQKLNLEFITASPDIDEHPKPNEQPDKLALRLAIEKALALQSDYPSHLIIGSDQVASFDNHILGKPGNHQNTIKQLKLQSGRSVNFYTSVCVLDASSGRYYTDIDLCTTYFKKLSDQQILNYVNLDTPYNCAGGFKAEGLGISLFDKIEGEDPNSLIGLPLIKLIKILERFDIQVI